MPGEFRDTEDVVVDRCKRVYVKDCDQVVLIGSRVTKQAGCIFEIDQLPLIVAPVGDSRELDGSADH